MGNSKGNSRSVFTYVASDSYDERHFGAINYPVYNNSLFAFRTHEDFDGAMQDLMGRHVYSRGNNPTVRQLELKLAQLEHGENAKCFGSGMAAITAAIFSVVGQGDHIVCTNQGYGPTREFIGGFLRRFGIESTFVDGKRLEAWKEAIRPNTKLLYLESPTSMLFELQNLQACTALAREIGAATIIDNTWATPCYQKPLTMGVDLVVHSLTKYVSGHSDCLGGVVVGSERFMNRICKSEYMLFGGIMTAQTASTVMRGLRTLPLRMERHERSGLLVAEHLGKQPYVAKVNHPGLACHPQHGLAKQQMQGSSSLFSFESDEPLEKLKAFADRLHYFSIGVSWGGYESLVNVNRIDPDLTGKPRNVVRLYVGLEDPNDLIADIDAAWGSVE